MTGPDEMLPQLGEAMERAGVEALAVAGNPDARVLIYAELSEQLEQAIFRHGPPDGNQLHCSENFDRVLDALRDAWEISRARGRKFRWRAVIYRIERGRMDVKLLYGREVDPRLTLYDKEEQLLSTYYPGVIVVPAVPSPGAFELEAVPRRPWWKLWG